MSAVNLGSFIAMALVLLTKLYHGTRYTCTDPKLLHIQVVEQDLSFTTQGTAVTLLLLQYM